MKRNPHGYALFALLIGMALLQIISIGAFAQVGTLGPVSEPKAGAVWKMCSGVYSGGQRYVNWIPPKWGMVDCQQYVRATGGIQFQVACFYNDTPEGGVGKVSWGHPLALELTPTTGQTPPKNCGFEQ